MVFKTTRSASQNLIWHLFWSLIDYYWGYGCFSQHVCKHQQGYQEECSQKTFQPHRELLIKTLRGWQELTVCPGKHPTSSTYYSLTHTAFNTDGTKMNPGNLEKPKPLAIFPKWHRSKNLINCTNLHFNFGRLMNNVNSQHVTTFKKASSADWFFLLAAEAILCWSTSVRTNELVCKALCHFGICSTRPWHLLLVGLHGSMAI